jgi:putative flippase GtrA
MPYSDANPVAGKTPASDAATGGPGRAADTGREASSEPMTRCVARGCHATYPRFVLLSGFAWLASLAVLWIGVNVLEWPAWGANAVGDGLAVSLVFALYPGTVFGSRHHRWLAAFAPWFAWQVVHIALISWAVDALAAMLTPAFPPAGGQWVEVAVKVALTPATITLNFLVARHLLASRSQDGP